MANDSENKTKEYPFGSEDLYKEDIEKMRRLGFEAGDPMPIKDVAVLPSNKTNTCERGVQYMPGFRVDFKKIN